jgi:hypothetical protein
MPIATPHSRRAEFLAYGEFSPGAGRSSWLVCGRARARADGSLVVSLDVLPTTGELHLRPLTRPPPAPVAAAPAAHEHRPAANH